MFGTGRCLSACVVLCVVCDVVGVGGGGEVKDESEGGVGDFVCAKSSRAVRLKGSEGKGSRGASVYWADVVVRGTRNSSARKRGERRKAERGDKREERNRRTGWQKQL